MVALLLLEPLIDVEEAGPAVAAARPRPGGRKPRSPPDQHADAESHDHDGDEPGHCGSTLRAATKAGGAAPMAAPRAGHMPGQGDEAGLLPLPLEAGDAAWEGVVEAALAITRPPTSPPPMRPTVTARIAQRRRHPLPAADGGGGGGGGGQSGGGGAGDAQDGGTFASRGFSALIGSPPEVVAAQRMGGSTLRRDDGNAAAPPAGGSAQAHPARGRGRWRRGGARRGGDSNPRWLIPHRFSRAAPRVVWSVCSYRLVLIYVAVQGLSVTASVGAYPCVPTSTSAKCRQTG